MKILEFPYKVKGFPIDMLWIYSSSLAGSSGGTLNVRLANFNIETLFPDVSRDQAAAGITQYRKIFVKNMSGLTAKTLNFQINPQSFLKLGIGNSAGTLGTDGSIVQSVETASVVTAVSSSASDTMDLVLLGENPVGTVVKDTITLTGTSPANSTDSFLRMINMELTSAPVGSVTVTRTSTLDIFQIGETFKFAFFTTEIVNVGNLISGGALPLWLARVIPAGTASTVKSEIVRIKAV